MERTITSGAAPGAATAVDDLQYQTGFGNSFATEALAGALPVGRNSPQQCAYGLYAEQFSGTAFTAPRAESRRSWLYRIRPAAQHGPFEACRQQGGWTSDFGGPPVTPNRMRWRARPIPQAPTDFIDGVASVGGNGGPDEQNGVGIHVYTANASMERFFCNADGELLLVPQQGRLRLATELGRLDVAPLEIAVIPRGTRFRVELAEGDARGYLLENFGAPLRPPERGPIGSNCLANDRDFETPVAWYEDRQGDFELVTKSSGGFWRADIGHSPLDVVAWHGNHVPYKYNLRRFNTLGSISFDHPDPSIFTVLTSPSDTPGTANVDVAIFPPRILVMEDTFRPPWFHRNISSEFMGLIQGVYDAKAEGFVPGGASLHNCMSGHGPDAETFEKARMADTSQPHHIRDTMAFMFETRRVIRPTGAAMSWPELQSDYHACWQGLRRHFDPTRA